MDRMKEYKQLIKELSSKTVVFAFGRFNPPTTGHELLVKAVKKLAQQKNADHAIYASRSQDAKKNPLSVDKKVKYLKLMFPRTTFVAANEEARTFIEAAKQLNKKYKNIVMVGGSDRVQEFKRLLNTYNGKDFHFDTIDVVSAGERDPDADDASGMSASKMRALAVKGDYAEFKKGLPSTVRDIDGKRLMNDIREGMGQTPIKEQILLVKDGLREQYFRGEIFNVGDIVESSGQQYTIAKRGSNHLLLKESTGKLVSKWIQDVQPIKEEITMNEELTNKTLKPNDKIKVARIISTMLGVENAEASSNPENLVNAALRKVRTKALNPEALSILDKMLALATEVGIDYDTALKPSKLKEGAIQPNGTDQIQVSGNTVAQKTKVTKKGVLTFYNFQKEQAANPADKAAKETAKANLVAKHAKEKESLADKQAREKESLSESHVELSKHISDFSKGVKSSSAKQSTYKRDGKPISNMKHVETDSDHQAVFKHLQKMGYKKTSGYDPKPNEFDMHHNRDEMTSKSDPVHHSSGVSAHVEKEHGGKMKVHFTHRGIKEETIIEDAYKDAEGHLDKADKAQRNKDMFSHHMHMADHHDSLSQWHDSKGRSAAADKHAMKAAEHEEIAHSLKSNYAKNAAKLKEHFHVLEEAVKAIDQGEYDYEGQMARTQLQTILRNSKDLVNMLSDEENMPEWVQSKITLAQDYISSVRDYLQSKEELGEDISLKEDDVVYSSDYKLSPSGRKVRAKRIEFKSEAVEYTGPVDVSKVNHAGAEPHDEEWEDTGICPEHGVKDCHDCGNAVDMSDYNKDYDSQMDGLELSDEEINKMVDAVSDEEIMDDYDEDELALVDDETGEEIPPVPEERVFDESALVEVLSRQERMRAKVRIRRTASKRERATKIALRRYSNTATINKRARRLAIKLMKQRMLRGRDPAKISVGEKERIERTLEKRKAIIGRVAQRLTSRVRKVEKARMSHTKFTQGNSNVGF
jgi:nicotinic acid mononucleotide adenylyltransferase